MRVGIVTPWYPPTVRGGGEISVRLLANQLVKSPEVNDIRVFAFDGRGDTCVENVPVRRLGSPPNTIREAANAYALYRFREVRDELAGLDILHAYNMALHPVTGYLSEEFDLVSVATLNSYDILPKRAYGGRARGLQRLYEATAMKLSGRVMLRLVKRIDAFIALSRASRAVYLENGFDDERIEVIPNMIDESLEPTPQLDTDDGVMLLFVGSLVEEKGVSDLIRALVHLPAAFQLRVVGSGPLQQSLEALANDLGVEPRVEFVGHVPYDDIREYYAMADLFVHPGVWPEPFGRTVLEAMQLGLPVVATDVGGPAEIVPCENCLCEPGEPTALASAIEQAWNSRETIGEQNRRHAREKFDPAVVTGQILALYDDITPG